MKNECKNCGGVLVFKPQLKSNVCKSCGSVFAVKYDHNFNKKPFVDGVELKPTAFSKEVKKIKCNSCGAGVILSRYAIHSQCSYCGNNQVDEVRKNRLMTVDSIIPFKFDKQQAIKLLNLKSKQNFFVNNRVIKEIKEEDIVATYVNAFVFDLNTASKYTGVFSYSKTEKDKDGTTRTVRVKKNVNGMFNKLFKDITIEANSNLNQNELLQIFPFNYAEAVKFKTDFLNGYMIEHHDMMFNECFSIAENYVKDDIRRELLRQHNCDRVEALNLDLVYLDRQYNYCLLPVYFVNKKIKNKPHEILINGQSGKMGNLPLSTLKILLTILCGFGLVLAVILAIVFNI